MLKKKSHGNSTIMGANVVDEAPQNKKRKKASGPKNYPSKKKFKGPFTKILGPPDYDQSIGRHKGKKTGPIEYLLRRNFPSIKGL